MASRLYFWRDEQGDLIFYHNHALAIEDARSEVRATRRTYIMVWGVKVRPMRLAELATLLLNVRNRRDLFHSDARAWCETPYAVARVEYDPEAEIEFTTVAASSGSS